jgi:hypothetical protein
LWISQWFLWKSDYVNSQRQGQILSDVPVEIPFPAASSTRALNLAIIHEARRSDAGIEPDISIASGKRQTVK